MNPVFWLLIFIAAVLCWVLISFIFIPIGKIIWKKWDKIMKIVSVEDEEKIKNE